MAKDSDTRFQTQLIQGSWWASKLGQHQVQPFQVLEASGQGIPKKVNLGDMPFWTHFSQIANRNKPETAAVAVFKQKTKKTVKPKSKKTSIGKRLSFGRQAMDFLGPPGGDHGRTQHFPGTGALAFTMAVFCCLLSQRKEGGSLLAMS